MSKRTVVVKRGDAEQLRVMGAAVRFLCGADKTDRAWSVMEVELPERAGPPPHDLQQLPDAVLQKDGELPQRGEVTPAHGIEADAGAFANAHAEK